MSAENFSLKDASSQSFPHPVGTLDGYVMVQKASGSGDERTEAIKCSRVGSPLDLSILYPEADRPDDSPYYFMRWPTDVAEDKIVQAVGDFGAQFTVPRYLCRGGSTCARPERGTSMAEVLRPGFNYIDVKDEATGEQLSCLDMWVPDYKGNSFGLASSRLPSDCDITSLVRNTVRSTVERVVVDEALVSLDAIARRYMYATRVGPSA